MSDQEQPPQPSQALAPRIREVRVVENDIAVLDTGLFEHMGRIAASMSEAGLIPEHLTGKKVGGQWVNFTPAQIKANCFLIVNQAIRWNMDPFAVMPETYVIGGKLSYQGKLVAAVVNARAGLDGRLDYEFSGTIGTDDFTITVSGKFKGDERPRTITLSVGQAKTDNQMWKKDPEQKLVYSGATKWARRWASEVILGVSVIGEIDDYDEPAPYRDVTPPVSAYDVPAGSLPAPAAETAPQGTRKRKTTAQKEEAASPASPAAPTASTEEAEKVVDQIASGEAAERAAIIDQIEKWLADNDPGFTLAMFAEGCKTTVEAFLGTADQPLDIPRLRSCLSKISTIHPGAKAQLAANAKAAAETAPKPEYEPVPEGPARDALFD